MTCLSGGTHCLSGGTSASLVAHIASLAAHIAFLVAHIASHILSVSAALFQLISRMETFRLGPACPCIGEGARSVAARPLRVFPHLGSLHCVPL